jgi:hypothetical protein
MLYATLPQQKRLYLRAGALIIQSANDQRLSTATGLARISNESSGFHVHDKSEKYPQTNDDAVHADIIKKIVILEINAHITVAKNKAESVVEFISDACQKIQHQFRGYAKTANITA